MLSSATIIVVRSLEIHEFLDLWYTHTRTKAGSCYGSVESHLYSIGHQNWSIMEISRINVANSVHMGMNRLLFGRLFGFFRTVFLTGYSFSSPVYFVRSFCFFLLSPWPIFSFQLNSLWFGLIQYSSIVFSSLFFLNFHNWRMK